jgi:peptidoglycan/LPS O-acetylase OafA/YrhL
MRRMAKGVENSNLDILRSAAVLAVFGTHTLQVFAGLAYGEHFAFGVETYALGQIGVLIFFVHTSLVLMQSLERAATRLSGWPLIRHFYIRRAFRIYPLSTFLILLSIIFSIPPNAVGTPYRWFGAGWVLENVFLVQNIGHMGRDAVSSPLWSLPYEVQMYLILPALFLLVRASGSRLSLIPIYYAGIFLSVFHPVFRYVPCFLAGVIAYKMLGAARPRLAAWLWCPAVIGAITLYSLTPYSAPGSLKDVIICLIVGSSIPLFQRVPGVIATAASKIAKYSYGVYLCHTPILWLLYRRMTIPHWQRPIWLVIATGGVSIACYYAVERPLIEAGSRFANRLSERLPRRAVTDGKLGAYSSLPEVRS